VVLRQAVAFESRKLEQTRSRVTTKTMHARLIQALRQVMGMNAIMHVVDDVSKAQEKQKQKTHTIVITDSMQNIRF